MKRKPFVPQELPLKEMIQMEKIIKPMVDCAKNIATYNAVIQKVKLDRQMLLMPLLLREALYSTKIEGTQATLDEVYQYESKKMKLTDDINEVLHYSYCLQDAINYVKDMPISTRLFKRMHQILLSDSARGKNRNPGEFRQIQNFIGPPGCTMENATFIPPEPQLIDHYLSNLEKYINTEPEFPLIQVAVIHAQFETIHPFLDGNGRLGRVLIPLCLYKYKEIDDAYFFVSESLELDKFKYYTLLNETRSHTPEGWTNWVEFFIRALSDHAKKQIEMINKIDALYECVLEQSKKVIKNNKIYDIITFIFRNPIFTIKQIENEIDLSYSTISGYIKHLQDIKVLYSDDSVRNRTFYFYELLGILR